MQLCFQVLRFGCQRRHYFTPNPHTCMQKLQGIGAKLTMWNKITFRDIRERKDFIIKDIAMV